MISEDRFDGQQSLSDGTVLKSANNSTGYANSYWSDAVRGGKFTAQIPKTSLPNDERFSRFETRNNRGYRLGFFDDAREAAYYAQYVIDHPEKIFDKYFSEISNFRDDRNPSVKQIVSISFPKDLYSLPNPSPEDCREWQRQRNRGERRVSPRTDTRVSQRDNSEDNLTRIAANQQLNNAEDTFVEYLNRPEFKQAWMATGEEKLDSREAVIDKIKSGASYEEALSYLKGYLAESIKRRENNLYLSEMNQLKNKLKVILR